MHELSIALSIVDGVLEEAERHGASLVKTVYLRIGRLSGVDKEALQFSYHAATEETPLLASTLVIEDIDVVIHCPACNAERLATSFPMLVCAECGTTGDRVIRGEELEIYKMEIAA